ncbi:MAG: universal stress protein [Flavobacteriales bacterium]|nr:universal stress protein [Flavobacteriales bacterium]MCB9168517.1 universal stress protein [Flavobacteriales bacterium]
MAHIVLPTDMSHNALRAAVHGVRLFGAKGNRFTLLHAYLNMNAGSALTLDLNEVILRAGREGLDEFEKKLRQEVELGDAQVKKLVEHGDLPNVIQRVAVEDGPVDCVVMGTQGASGLKEVLIGSNTADVIDHSPVPVLAVPGESIYREPRRIVLADDGGKVGASDIRPLLDIARAAGAEITIVRVVAEDEDPERPVVSRYDDLLGTIPHTHRTISSANISGALNDLVDQSDADLVVMLHRHRSLFGELFHRSASRRLVMHTHVPVLVLERRDG